MQEAFEKIIKKLEELAESNRESGFDYEQKGFSNTADKSYAKQCAYLNAIEIVKREAEKMCKKKTSKRVHVIVVVTVIAVMNA